MKLNDKLKCIDSYPFHMPGHKRNGEFGITGAEIDITEIEGFDNLHNPTGILKNLENEISSIYNSKKSIISVNGSTCCILSAICALCPFESTVIIARNCHKSVYNACMIRRLNVIYIEPEFDEFTGVYTKVTQKSIETILNAHPEARAAVITSPTYEGITSDIKTDIPLIVDAAHGSHLGFADYLPEKQSGDIVINSFHKTLPCLTQTAAVHIYNEKYSSCVQKYMDIFETSSPSYILLASVEKCVEFLKNSSVHFKLYKKRLNDFYNKTDKLPNIHILKNDDLTRFVITADGYGGEELASVLRKGGIEPEGFGLNYVILISTVCDTEVGFDTLYNSLKKIKKRKKAFGSISKPVMPEKIYNSFEIDSVSPTELDKAEGLICGEYIYAYPPGVPLIVPGEKIDTPTVEYIKKLTESGVNVISDGDLKNNTILTKSIL